MKQKISPARIARLAALLSLIFFANIISARAQVLPFVDCVERVDDANYRAYFGYVSLNTENVEIAIDSPGNLFTPVPTPPGQPDTFAPGVHHHVVAVTVPNGTDETWILSIDDATARAQTLLPCNDAESNTRTITYQGRLTDGTTAANRQYDLRFQLFDAATGGASKSAPLALENVQVTNGIFTAQLDFGILPAILDGRNLFLEIGVRAGTSTGAYTTLAPRQPLTATPYAIRAQSAANADLLGGSNREDFIFKKSEFGQTIESDLTFTGTLTGTIRNATYATNAANATNAAQLGGVAANNYLTTTNANTNFIQNTTTRQTGNFNISGSGNIGGGLTVGGNGTGTARIGDLFGSGNYTGISLNNSTNPNDYNFLSSPTEKTLYINRPDGNSIIFRKNNQTQMTLDNNGNLTATGTITSGCRSGFTAISGGHLCVSAMQPANTFYAAAQVCTDMSARLGNSFDVALTFTLGSFNYFETTNPSVQPIPKGWLADIIGDNVRATWNANTVTQDFDGAPLNVNTGGSGGGAPSLLFRCVY